MNDNAGTSSLRAPLISRTSILLLAGCLLGMTAGEIIGENVTGLNRSAYMVAIVAVISFIGLDTAWKRRKLRAEQRAEKAAARRMDKRVERHVRD